MNLLQVFYVHIPTSTNPPTFLSHLSPSCWGDWSAAGGMHCGLELQPWIGTGTGGTPSHPNPVASLRPCSEAGCGNAETRREEFLTGRPAREMPGGERCREKPRWRAIERERGEIERETGRERERSQPIETQPVGVILVL